MSTHTNTTTDFPCAPAGEFTRYSGIEQAREALREGNELLLGGFPRHIVTVKANKSATFDSLPSEVLTFSLAEDEVQAQVERTEMSLAQLVTEFGTLEAKAKLAEIPGLNHVCFNLHLIGKLGFNL